MAETRLDRFLHAAFKIEPGELGKTAAMFLYLFSAVGAFVIGRIARDTLFLTEWPEGRAYLAHMYYLAPLSVSVVAWLYSRIADRFHRDHLILWTTGILIGCLVFGATAGRGLGSHAYYIGLYIFVEVMGMFLTLQFWTFANDVIDAREGKRLFSVIATGGVVASIACGQLVQTLIPIVGISGLLLLCAALLGSCMGCVAHVARRERMSLTTASARRGTRKRKIRVAAESSRLLTNRYLLSLALMLTVTFVACPLVDYQWKLVARETFPEKLAFARYQGNFYTYSGMASLIFQLVLTRRILKQFGIFVALMVLPVFIATGTVFNLLLPGLVAVTLAKGSETAFRYTINDSSLALLYLTIPAQQRGRVKAFLEGIVKNWALAAAGLLLAFVLKPLLPAQHYISWVLLVPLAAWFLCLWALRREYLPTLLSALKRGRQERDALGPDMDDESTANVVRRALSSDDEEEILHAIDLMRSVETLRLDSSVLALLGHVSDRVRVAAAQEISRTADPAHAPALERAFGDPSPDVRIAAIAGLCALRQHAAIPQVRPFLTDASPAIRAAAIVGLLKHGGLDGVLCAADGLKHFLGHEQPQMRVHAARILGEVGVANFYQPLLGLFEDPSREVQIAAIQSAGALCPLELIPVLVRKLGGRATSLVAMEALAAYRDGVEPALEEVLVHPVADPEWQASAATCLARIGSRPALAVLERALVGKSEATVRHRVHRSLDRIISQHPELGCDRARIREACRAELAQIQKEDELARAAGDLSTEPLLKDALTTRRQMMLRGIFHLLNVLHPEGRFGTVWDNLGSENRATRAHAIEVIDTVVERALRESVLALVEPGFKAPSGATGAHSGPGRDGDVATATGSPLARLLNHESPWIVAASLSSLVGRLSRADPDAAPRELLVHAAATRDRPSAIVRQTSLWVMATVAPGDPDVLRQAREHAGDENPEVREFARATLRRIATDPEEYA